MKNYIHSVKDDLQNISLNPEIFNKATTDSEISFNKISNLINHFIRAPYSKFLNNNDDSYFKSCWCDLHENMFKNNQCEFLNNIKESGIDYKKIYYITNNVDNYLAGLLFPENNEKLYNKFHKIFEPYYIDAELYDEYGNPENIPFLHIGIDISTNYILNNEKFICLLKLFKQTYNVKIHILGGINTHQYFLYKNIADYFYIGNLHFTYDDHDYIFVDDYNNKHKKFFEHLPVYVNYAKLLYDCNQMRLINYKEWPKLIVTDFGLSNDTIMESPEHLLCFALGADFILSSSIFIKSEKDIKKGSNSHFYYHKDANTAIFQLSKNLFYLLDILNVQSISELHTKTSKIIQAPWLNNSPIINKSYDNNVNTPLEF